VDRTNFAILSVVVVVVEKRDRLVKYALGHPMSGTIEANRVRMANIRSNRIKPDWNLIP
jgi:hypothetical protein